jgi:predicted PurR-regulated permease PerM
VQHGVVRGLGLAAYGVLVIGGIDNLLRPLLTRRGLRMHPFLTFIAIFGGVAAYGFKGLFLGPLVIALAVTVIDLYERRLRLRGVGDAGAHEQLTLPLPPVTSPTKKGAADAASPHEPEPQSA